MPQLRLNITQNLSKEERIDFSEWVINKYAEIMVSPNSQIAIIIDSCELGDLHIGIDRITRPEKGVLILNMDINKGQDQDKKRALIIAIMEEAEKRWGIPTKNMHVTITEHDGEDFNFYEGHMES